MDLEQEILKEHSKKQADKIAAWVVLSSENLAQFIHLFLNGSYRVTQRAAMVLGILGRDYFDLLQPHLGKLITNLQTPHLHDAVKRNTLRFLQTVNVPNEYMGTLASVCFNFLGNPTEAVAIKAFSMSVLLNITKTHPDLKNELKLLIEEQLPHGSAGIKSRGNKILKALERIN